MMRFIPGLPEHVLAIQGTGTVTDADYRSVLMPAAESKIREFGKVAMLYHLGPGFEGFEAKAVWDDAMVEFKHRRHWEKVAIVTDAAWLGRVVRVLSFMVSAAVRVFPGAELEEAKAWVAEPGSS